jgi:hypothetical protein
VGDPDAAATVGSIWCRTAPTELQLLMKAKDSRPEDDADFLLLFPELPPARGRVVDRFTATALSRPSLVAVVP